LETFLKTAIVIDDSIGRARSFDADEAEKQAMMIESPPAGANIVSFEPKDGGAAKKHKSIDFNKVAEGFFEKGIICGLYNPRDVNEEEQKTRLEHLCAEADIIVIDWYLDKHKTIVVDVLKKLCDVGALSHSHAVHQVVIYSWKIDDVVIGLNAAFGDNCVDAGRKIFSIGDALTGLLIGKEDVEEEKLAKYLIGEFEKEAHGLLSDFALLGLASVQSNIKRVLYRFHKNIDLEFALHSIMTRKEDDIKEQLVALLVEELRSSLEDDQNIPSSQKIYDTIVDRIRPIIEGKGADCLKNAFEPLLKDGVGISEGIDILSDYLKKGKEKLREYLKKFIACKRLTSRDLDAIINALAILSGKDRKCIGAFSALMSNRAVYASKKLCCGTVVEIEEQGDKGEYVCVMPSCDSIRLLGNKKTGTVKTNFLFWRLKDCGFDESSDRSFVIEKHDGEEPSYEHKLIVGKFCKYAIQKEIVCDTDVVLFNAENKIPQNGFTIRWLGQLKEFHAQRIMHFVGNSLSKVGLLEDEMTRLLAITKE
jgi:hypothetical protein